MIACTSPLFTVRSRPLRICRLSTTTDRFLISSIATSTSQTEMQNDLSDQFLPLRAFVPRRKAAERLAAGIDLALLADDNHQPVAELPFGRTLQGQAALGKGRHDPVVLELLRSLHILLVERLEERA